MDAKTIANAQGPGAMRRMLLDKDDTGAGATGAVDVNAAVKSALAEALKELRAQAPAPAPEPAFTKKDMEEAIAKASAAAVKQALNTTVSDPSAGIIDDAGGDKPKAPRVAKFKMPRAWAGREERNDEAARAKDPRIVKGLPMARCGLAFMKQREFGAGCSYADAADYLGYRKLADSIDAARPQGSAMSEGAADAGGSFVPSELQNGFIDSLEHLVAIRPLIPASNIVRSSRPEIQWPVITSGLSGGWVGENPSTGNPEALGTGMLTLRARKCRVEVVLGRDLLRDSVANLEQIVYGKMSMTAAQLEDLAIVEGSGSEFMPKGLALWAVAANNKGAATATPAYKDARTDLRKLLKQLATQKINQAAGRAFVGTEIHRWGLGDLENSAGTAYPFEEQLSQGRLMGYPAGFSTQLNSTNASANNRFYCFAPGEAVLFDMLGMYFEEDNTYLAADGTTKTASGADQTVLRLWRRMDFGMQHGEAVTFIHTVPWGQ